MRAARSYALGSRVRVRGEEWVVEKSMPVRGKRGLAHAVHVQGLTELVRHHKAIFVDDIDRIDPLAPQGTKLVVDDSAAYRKTRLFFETLLRRTPPTDASCASGTGPRWIRWRTRWSRRASPWPSCGSASSSPTGSGSARPSRSASCSASSSSGAAGGGACWWVAIRSMLAQLQQELWVRFALPLVRLDSEGIRRVHAKIPTNMNPLSHFERAIISVDTLKNERRYGAWEHAARWTPRQGNSLHLHSAHVEDSWIR